MLKDQIISLFYLFPILNEGGYFIVEELVFPETREDMRIDHHAPDLKTILLNILENKDFNSPYIDEKNKKYFLDNIESIKICRGNINEIAILKKKWKFQISSNPVIGLSLISYAVKLPLFSTLISLF